MTVRLQEQDRIYWTFLSEYSAILGEMAQVVITAANIDAECHLVEYFASLRYLESLTSVSVFVAHLNRNSFELIWNFFTFVHGMIWMEPTRYSSG